MCKDVKGKALALVLAHMALPDPVNFRLSGAACKGHVGCWEVEAGGCLGHQGHIIWRTFGTVTGMTSRAREGQASQTVSQTSRWILRSHSERDGWCRFDLYDESRHGPAAGGPVCKRTQAGNAQSGEPSQRLRSG